ncbi:MAG TPA: CAP domain-containing protein [Solirubrobacteraceae bacterium]|nr:CAP domain-containing protein [Solirubrobacteraceae bacterium]
MTVASATARRAGAPLLLAIALAAGCGPVGERTVTIEQPGAGATRDEEVPQTEVRAGDCANADRRPTEENLSLIEQATRCLVDAERVKRDRSPLAADAQLREAARAKAGDMVEQRYFAHAGPDGREVHDWVGPTGYLEGSARIGLGENLGWASEGAATPLQLVEGWMNSASHRRNILRAQWRDTGVGVVLGAPREEGGGGATYVQMFGRK